MEIRDAISVGEHIKRPLPICGSALLVLQIGHHVMKGVRDEAYRKS